MGLSRLDNFLKSARGTILYVNPNDLDATDSIENQGNSLTRPFKTIQRALIESARFSYQKGLENDRFAKTTILIYPGDHVIDNRPGYIPIAANQYRLRNGSTTNNLPPFDLTSNFDLSTSDNELYKLNSVHGGVIVPRGTSLVGLDLRKTKIRPRYVPNPTNDDIERSALFRVTGGCYFWQFSMFDADPNGQCFKDYSENLFVPNFSHHKLTCFEYADGVNNVKINDSFISGTDGEFDRTDLQMYYEKVGLVYGASSGRAIEPDYPSSGLDIQPKIDEYRIVGSQGKTVGISSIFSGDSVIANTTVTVSTNTPVPELQVDTPFSIKDVGVDEYNGQFVVSEVINPSKIKYQVQNTPVVANPSSAGSELSLTANTVTSASPYIFNVSLRSVFGTCGLLADGKKATGFKSMVVAQFTGIGLQKDDNAFVLYNTTNGEYDDSTAVTSVLSNNSKAIYKPSYRNFHIRVTNDAFIQAVSIFAIGYAEHFSSQNGADISLTNSNSNFGSKSLSASGFKKDAFTQDDKGYITHIIPPKQLPLSEVSVEVESLDVQKTAVGVASTGNLYLYGKTNPDTPPENVIEGYRVGARKNDDLKVLISDAGAVTEKKARIVMAGSQSSSEKSFDVARTATGNTITNNVIRLDAAHDFINGESVRVISDNGHLPDGLDANTLYYVITTGSGINTNTDVKLSKTLSDALITTAGQELTINNRGGSLKVVSRVSDKNSGELGHPIQFDTTNSQWYVNVSTTPSENTIYPSLVSLGTTVLGSATPRTFITRIPDARNADDTIYRARYVIPKDAGTARPPSDGFILQESNTGIGATDAEVQSYFGSGTLTNENQLRNFRIVADANWSGTEVSVQTELPHNLTVGSEVELVNVKSTTNTTGVGNSGFNRTFAVTGISSAKNFTVGLTTDPGTFTSDVTSRTVSLPYFKRKRFKDTYYIQGSHEAQKFIAGSQDGIYYLTVVNASNSPTISEFAGDKYSQPVKELFPQTNRDNPVSDPEETKSFAVPDMIGKVVVNDVQKSVTKETLTKFNRDVDTGIALTNIVSSTTGIAHTLHSSVDHGLNKATLVSIANSGNGYGIGSAVEETYYNANLVSIGASVTGVNATAKVTVAPTGGITAIELMDGGSSFNVGNTLAVVGIATTTGYSQATVTVSKVYDNTGDSIRVIGVSSATYAGYNSTYRITGVGTQGKEIYVTSTSAISGVSTTGIGATAAAGSYSYLTGESLRVSSIVYNNVVGLATVTTVNNHGLKVDNRVEFVGADQALYNDSFVVTENVGLSTFVVNIGVNASSPATTGTIFAYRDGYASNGGLITVDDENLNGRMIPSYAGITTTLAAAVTNTTTETVALNGRSGLDIRNGDYFTIDDEIVRVKTAPSGVGDSVSVFRGVLGSKRATHISGSLVRRIHINPIELRRHSIIRASGHTFEYVGYGPGNYSTALPDKHDREITPEEELLAQSIRKDGGVNFYTGMNAKGISFTGNKKSSSITGKEEIFDTPVQTVTGEDIGNLADLNVTQATEGVFSRSIRVEGGPDNKVATEFNGPIIVNNKLTVNSSEGFEANSLFLQGDKTVSRKYTLSGSTPTLAGNPGDITYFSDPSQGGYAGWIYSVDNEWRRFGSVGLAKDANINVFDQVGIGTTTPGTNTLQVGAGTSLIAVSGAGDVGFGVTASGFKFNVSGNSNITGILTATKFVGDGSGLTGINAAATGWTNYVGSASSITYNTNLSSNGRVGIGSTIPSFLLEVGTVGTGDTTLNVNGHARFVDQIDANTVNITGILTSVNYNLQSATGKITVGVITTTDLKVGSGSTILATSAGGIGIGILNARANLDVEGHTRLKTYSENVGTLSVDSNVATIDLSTAQTFDYTLSDNITSFKVINAPAGSSSFVLKITQDGAGSRTVGIDTFVDGSSTTVPVYWPGGVVPIVTSTPNRSDIISFKIIDGSNLAANGLFGVITGQNFS